MNRTTRRIGATLGGALLLLTALLCGRTALTRSRQPPINMTSPTSPTSPTSAASGAPGAALALGLDEQGALLRLRRAVQFATVSHQDPARRDPSALIGLRDFLGQAFPRVHAALQREVVAEHSLLFTWRGRDPKLAPMLLMGHMDVVPLEPGTESRWTVPPFAGEIRDGYLWGRGTMDDKAGVMSTLEAAELLLSQGYTPQRTVYLAFGHDEELEGHGAAALAQRVRTLGLPPVLVMDEGLAITQGMMPGVSAPVAMIGTAQKGYLTVALRASSAGGHSSMPPPQGAVGALAAALVRLEKHAMSAQLSGPTNDMFDWIGPEMSGPLRLIMTNRWLFAPVVTQILLNKPNSAALVRTTTALTMLSAGVKENVLPTGAEGVANFRIRPGESSAGVVDEVRRVVGPGIAVQVLGVPIEPSRASPADSPRFLAVARSLRAVDPSLLVAPALMLGYADARFYEGMTADVYRFRPMLLRGDDPQRIHGIDERISLADYARHIRFYVQILKDLPTQP